MAETVFEKPLDKKLNKALMTIVEECAKHHNCWDCPFGTDSGSCQIASDNLPTSWVFTEKSGKERNESVETVIRNAGNKNNGGIPVFGDSHNLIRDIRNMLRAYYNIQGLIDTVSNLTYSMGAELSEYAIEKTGITDAELEKFNEFMCDKLEFLYRFMVADAIANDWTLMDILVKAAVGEDGELIEQKGD